jgi:hypothetical protein
MQFISSAGKVFMPGRRLEGTQRGEGGDLLACELN